jgi:hypothetical protein
VTCASDDVGPAPCQAHSETSREAAAILQAGGRRHALREEVLGLLLREGPMTDEEMQRKTGMNPSTQRPRRVELLRLGLVKATGETRRTASGRRAAVWGVAKGVACA